MKRKRTAVGRLGVPRSADAGSDFPPLTKAELAKLRPVSLAKRVRWKLGLSQADFAKRYKIPLGTLRDWEQHQSVPDQAAISYLTAIEGEPTKIAKVHARTLPLKLKHNKESGRWDLIDQTGETVKSFATKAAATDNGKLEKVAGKGGTVRIHKQEGKRAQQ